MKRRCSLLLLMLLASLSVLAHDPRPVVIDIEETAPFEFRVQWRIPDSIPATAVPRVVMPAHCSQEQVLRASGYSGAMGYACPEGISGHQVQLSFPSMNPSLSTLIQLRLQSGEKLTRILSPGEEVWRIPEQPSALTVAQQYSWLGVTHIWAGYDHLLFVTCLLFFAGTVKRILITITGFTLAHSLTLAMQVLGFVSLPVPPVEAVIALSIVFLAHELAVDNPDSWTWRYPVLVSSLFGLLHGFGFASVLLDLGLPQTERLVALLCFNLGVEIGQLLFVALVVFLLRRWLVDFSRHQLPQLQRIVSLLVGITASYWLVERVAGFWG